MHRRMPLVTLVGYALGVAVMLGLKWLTEQKENEGVAQRKQPTSLLATLMIDVALDGMLIGLGFAAGEKQGLLLTIALSMEVFFLGLSFSTALSGAGASKWKTAGAVGSLALILVAGALVGAILVASASSILLDAILAFGLATLLHLVTEELLVEAHETPETPFQAAMFFVGFIVLLIIEMLL